MLISANVYVTEIIVVAALDLTWAEKMMMVKEMTSVAPIAMMTASVLW